MNCLDRRLNAYQWFREAMDAGMDPTMIVDPTSGKRYFATTPPDSENAPPPVPDELADDIANLLFERSRVLFVASSA